MNVRLQASHLWLDPLAATDEAFYVALYTDGAAMRHVMAPQSAGAARRGFRAALELDAQSPPRRRFWVLRTKHDATRVGLLGLDFDGDGDSAEVGAVIAPVHQGHGHATAAIAAVAGHAFSTLGLQRLHTRHDDGHGAAAGLMRTLGFERVRADAGRHGWCWQTTPERWRQQVARGGARANPLP